MEKNAAQIKGKSLLEHLLCSEVLPKSFLESNVFSYSLETEGATKISTLYKISSSKFISIFESKRAISRFGDKEIILSSQKQRSGPLGNGKEPIFMTMFFPEYISDQAVRLALSTFEKSSFCLLADMNLSDIEETEICKHDLLDYF